MAINKYKGKRVTRWVADFRDADGRRRYVTSETKREAELVLARRSLQPGTNPHVRFEEAAHQWLAIARTKVRPQTLRVYERNLRLHVLPAMKGKRLSKIRPSDVELVLASKLAGGMAPKTVSSIQGVLFGVFQRAVKDGTLVSNPTVGLGKELGLRRRSPVAKKVKAFTPEECAKLLATAKELYSHLYPMLLTMLHTGLRRGEAIALQWADVALDGELVDGQQGFRIRVSKSMLETGEVDTTKTDRIRHVDMSEGLRAELRRHRKLYLEQHLSAGRTSEPWVFQRPNGGYVQPHSLDAQFKKILAHAGLPLHFYPHCLRHTFASLHIRLGTPLTYLKEQLGHSSIAMTADIYGSWLSKTNMEAANRLDQALQTAKSV